MSNRSFRVNAEYLPQHKGKMVTIVGKLVDRESDPFVINSTDMKTVRVHKNPALDEGRFKDAWIEVTGRVQDNGEIEEENSIPVSSNVDTETWNGMVKLAHKYKELF